MSSIRETVHLANNLSERIRAEFLEGDNEGIWRRLSQIRKSCRSLSENLGRVNIASTIMLPVPETIEPVANVEAARIPYRDLRDTPPDCVPASIREDLASLVEEAGAFFAGFDETLPGDGTRRQHTRDRLRSMIRERATELGYAADPLRLPTSPKVGSPPALPNPLVGPLRAQVDDDHQDTATPREQNVLRKTGNTWTVAFKRGVVGHLSDMKGFACIAHLLARPHESIDSIDLEKTSSKPTSGKMSSSLAAEHGLSTDRLGSDPRLDAQAFGKCKEEYDDLERKLDIAKRDNDSARIEQLETDRRAFASYMSQGCKKLNPSASGPTDRVRKNIENAIESVLSHDADFGQHLKDTITLGQVCRYDPVHPVDWQL